MCSAFVASFVVQKKPKPIIAPQRSNAGPKLMDDQDIKNKGDGTRAPRRPTTILFPDGLKRDSQAHATTLTRLIVDGLRWRVSQVD